MAIATGGSTVDGRPIAWKNRDHWTTPDGWKVVPYRYTAAGTRFGAGDRYSARFDYVGISALDASGRDEKSGIQIPWAGANVRGLGLVQVDGHTLTASFAEEHGFTASQDPARGMTSGFLNHVILSRAERVDEVEEILRDTNDGGGYHGSFARDTASIIGVFDRWGNAAIFEIDGDSFTRDNITAEYHRDRSGHFTARHDDDKDAPNPPDGAYSGYDWRTNFSRVQWSKPNGFPYFVDAELTVGSDDAGAQPFREAPADSVGALLLRALRGNEGGSRADGVHDWESSASAIHRHGLLGAKMDQPGPRDYRDFIQKRAGAAGYGLPGTVETIARSIGDLPSGPKDTGELLNRFVSTFGVVIEGAKIGDPYDGKLTTLWVALGEPAVSIFVPIFPYAGPPPSALEDMYLASNQKRHLVYSYTSDDACGYRCGRNADHRIDTSALVGPAGPTSGDYGAGGIQRDTFAIEAWAFAEYDRFIADLRRGARTPAELKSDMAAWQQRIAEAMKQRYLGRTGR